jgi:hypothetical protein
VDPTAALIEVRVSALVRDAKTDAPVVLLQVLGTKRHLPIWIGDAEANAIAMVLAGRRFQRPLTHDLMQQIVDGLGGKLSRVVVTDIQGNTYFARLYLSRGHELVAIDARPSDSIALALRCESPIFLSQKVAEVQADNMLEAEESVDKQQVVENLIRDVQNKMDPDDPGPPDDFDEEGGEWPSSDPTEE